MRGAEYQHVRCHGLWGTYDDGLEWLKRPDNLERPKCILSLGSSIGNFARAGAATFLRNFATGLSPNDILLVGIDGCQDGSKVYHAYNDREGKTHEFILNGLTHANYLLEQKIFNVEDWKVVGEYDKTAGRHYACVVPVRDVDVDGVHVSAGEKVQIEESYKYSPIQTRSLWEDAGLVSYTAFGDHLDQYRKSHNVGVTLHHGSPPSSFHDYSPIPRGIFYKHIRFPSFFENILFNSVRHGGIL